MLKRKLYAFSKPINYFLDMPFDTHVNVYAKEKLCFSSINQYQLSELNTTDLRDVIGMSMHDIFSDHSEAEQIMRNDLEVMNKRSTSFFVEDSTFPKMKKRYLYFSLKTTLNDSSGHVVGCFGLSCKIKDISFALAIETINKLNVIPTTKIFSTSVPFVLNHHFSILTKRQQECVYCLMRCMTYKEIAKSLGNIQPKTVEKHVEHIKDKLNVYSRSDIVNKVSDWKLL